MTTGTAGDLVTVFRGRAEAAGCSVHQLDGGKAVATLALGLAGNGTVAVAPQLAAAHPGLVDALGGAARVVDGEDPTGVVAGCAVGVTMGVQAVAESGSVLVVEDELADRAVSMLVSTLVQVVRAEAVVASLDDAAAWLSEDVRGAGYAALVTGPSRTADIERSLTIGVQGPAAVHIVLLEEDT